MKIATTTGDFSFYCTTDEARIRELHRAGFRYIDLSLYSMKPDSPYLTDGWQDEVDRLKALADSLGMQFVQAHSHGFNPLTASPESAAFHIRAVERSIEICGMLEIPNTVLHGVYAPGLSREESFAKNKEYVSQFFPLLERTGVNLLLENSTAANMKEIYYPNTGADLRALIEYIGHPNVHACWDTGHANCEGPQYEQILALGEHLLGIHYNDNHGQKDEHLPPYMGTLNHDEILHALIDVGYRGYFTLECGASLIKKNGWPHKRRAFDDDTRLAQPQLFMQQQTEKLLYDTAKYILEAYEQFEE